MHRHFTIKQPHIILLIMSILGFGSKSHAENLNVMQVQSGLNEPLEASIPLDIEASEQNSTPEIRVHSIKKNHHKISQPINPTELNVIRNDNQIKLLSKDIIDTPRLDVVLEIKKGHSVEYKQYAIHLSEDQINQPSIVIAKDTPQDQSTTQTTKKSFRRKSVSNPKNSPRPKTDSQLTQLPAKHSDSPEHPSPADQSTHNTTVSTPIDTPSLEEAPRPNMLSIDKENEPNLVIPETRPVTLAKTVGIDWVTLIFAFVTGIGGVLVIQKLLSGFSPKVKPERLQQHIHEHPEENRFGTNNQAITSNIAPFEELLQEHLINAKTSSIENNQPHTQLCSTMETEEDFDYGFDFNIPR